MPRPSIADAAWLLLEARERPMHVGGLLLFRPPEDAPPTYLRDLADELREPVGVRPPFNWRLSRPYSAPGLNSWVEDEVELDFHLRHVALPDPGRIRELLALVSRVHGNLLDRHRPLWESYLVEGIEDGRFASYTKVHHSLMDGVAAMRQMMKAFSPDPEERGRIAPWGAHDEEGDARDDGGNAFVAARRLIGGLADGITSSGGVLKALADQIARAPFDPSVTVPFEAPPSMLNAQLTGARRFVAQSYDLDRIRSVSKTLGVTINDVVLTMCSGALRTYLADHGALPRRPLIALVPVSFRREDGSDSGNAITLVPTNLATHLADPAARLDLIRSSMDRVKQRVRDLSPTQLIEYGFVMTAPVILGSLTGLAGRVGIPSYNVVISNVPGPDQPLYWNGARLEGMYPVSLLTEGYALNITQTSYAGSMEFGITADRRALPSIQRLIDHLEDALAELEETAGP
jgi:diacylglycerol O-acyltransferase / wax synthase